MKSLISLYLSFGFLFFTFEAWGLPSDKEQKILIRADKSNYYGGQGVSTLVGHAEVEQGTMKVLGDLITIQSDTNGDIKVVTSEGERAYFEQVLEIGKNPIKAYAKKIQYDIEKGRVYLTGDSMVVDSGDIIKAEIIVYDVVHRTLFSGAKTSGGSERARVEIILLPKNRK